MKIFVFFAGLFALFGVFFVSHRDDWPLKRFVIVCSLVMAVSFGAMIILLRVDAATLAARVTSGECTVQERNMPTGDGSRHDVYLCNGIKEYH